MKPFWAAIGIISFLLGLVGVVLPLLPTVPFMLLSAYCFSRSSERLHSWLINHPKFGPAIIDWQTKGAISLQAKKLATCSVVLVGLLSIVLKVPGTILLIQAIVLSCVLIFIWSRPRA